MKKAIFSIFLLAFVFSITTYNSTHAGGGSNLPFEETDSINYQLYSFFDLRDRESFIQLTNQGPINTTIHIQVFDVSNLCNENNFFDRYTPNDTHVYNMRDITTNDGNSAGFVLQDGAYGFVVATNVIGVGQQAGTRPIIIGNFRVLDNSGYEYRSNSQGPTSINQMDGRQSFTFNFSSNGGVVASDVIGITVNNITSGEVTASGSSVTFNTTLFNNNEVEFSCSDTTFSCTADTFEYGINDAIPNSRDGDLTCGSNVIAEGFVEFNLTSSSNTESFSGYVGLNNGNGRGSMDSMFFEAGDMGCGGDGQCTVFYDDSGVLLPTNFGALSVADQRCQDTADSAGLKGTYLAWISNDTESPSTRFTRNQVPYVLPNGTVIANNYTDLTDGTLQNSININADGNPSGSGLFTFTGTLADGSPTGVNCANWTSMDMTEFYSAGNSFETGPDWSFDENFDCVTTGQALYCFEQ